MMVLEKKCKESCRYMSLKVHSVLSLFFLRLFYLLFFHLADSSDAVDRISLRLERNTKQYSVLSYCIRGTINHSSVTNSILRRYFNIKSKINYVYPLVGSNKFLLIIIIKLKRR